MTAARIDDLPAASPLPVERPTDVLLPTWVASALQISVREVQDQLASGEISGGFKVGRLWRIRRKEFDAWLEKKAGGAS